MFLKHAKFVASEKKFNKKSFAIATLRRATYRLVARTEALRAAKIARNQYVCAICKKVFGRKDIQLDHIEPVISVTEGWQGFDTFIDRLIVEKEGFQVLCKEACHKTKTEHENRLRKFHDAAREKRANKLK